VAIIYNRGYQRGARGHQVACKDQVGRPRTCSKNNVSTGAEPDIFIRGGHWRGQFCNKGAVSGLCRTFRKRPTERDLIFGGTGKIWGRTVALPGTPLAPPLR